MRVRILSLLLVFCLFLSACGSQESPESPEVLDSAVTFTDDLGRSITVDSPRRVAPLLGSFAQIWMLAGGTVHATAEDAWDDLNLDLPETAINLGRFKSGSSGDCHQPGSHQEAESGTASGSGAGFHPGKPQHPSAGGMDGNSGSHRHSRGLL